MFVKSVGEGAGSIAVTESVQVLSTFVSVWRWTSEFVFLQTTDPTDPNNPQKRGPRVRLMLCRHRGVV